MFQCDCPPFDCASHVQRYLEGDRSAGDVLARKFTPLVMSIVQRVLGPNRRDEWEDASQAIFLRLFHNLDKWESRCPFCKWLAVLAARRAIDLSRVVTPSVAVFPLEEIVDSRPSHTHTETLEQIARVIDKFPEDWRKVWALWAQGANRDEMAQGVNKSIRTIQYWLAEMLDDVREALADE